MNVGAGAMLGMGFPFATMAVNIIGCFIMGLLLGYGALHGTAIIIGSGLYVFRREQTLARREAAVIQ